MENLLIPEVTLEENDEEIVIPNSGGKQLFDKLEN